MKYYLQAFRQYTDFDGRASRSEYWFFTLFNIFFAVLAIVLDNVFEINLGESLYGPIYLIYAIATLSPALAVATRRLHDIGKSGWMLWVALIPVIGAIWLLVLMCTPSEERDNAFGDYEDKADIPEKDQSFNIVLCFLIYTISTRLFYQFLPKIDEHYYDKKWSFFIMFLLNFYWAFIPFMITFLVRDKKKRNILSVIALLFSLFAIYRAGIQFYEAMHSFAIRF